MFNVWRLRDSTKYKLCEHCVLDKLLTVAQHCMFWMSLLVLAYDMFSFLVILPLEPS